MRRFYMLSVLAPIEGSSITQPVDEIQLFYDAVGGRNKRNQIYDLGSSQEFFISHVALQSPVTPALVLTLTQKITRS